ncbi:MAG: hypothetical protein Ctma_1075 [Catillopecten margaritatus gill symbiont]|uniref:Prokaryotic metallothionein n=1 Tax=Catillopecten margaritatus gill symbiont TaxID=3083288 RepID=A0AAU6PH41_9GAMM
MGLIKILPFVLLAVVGFVLWKKLRGSVGVATQQPSANKMVECSACKTHIPENEAIMQDGKIYCSKACL